MLIVIIQLCKTYKFEFAAKYMTPAVDWGLTKSIAGKRLSYVPVLHRRTKLNFI